MRAAAQNIHICHYERLRINLIIHSASKDQTELATIDIGSVEDRFVQIHSRAGAVVVMGEDRGRKRRRVSFPRGESLGWSRPAGASAVHGSGRKEVSGGGREVRDRLCESAGLHAQRDAPRPGRGIYSAISRPVIESDSRSLASECEDLAVERGQGGLNVGRGPILYGGRGEWLRSECFRGRSPRGARAIHGVGSEIVSRIGGKVAHRSGENSGLHP